MCACLCMTLTEYVSIFVHARKVRCEFVCVQVDVGGSDWREMCVWQRHNCCNLSSEF